MIKKRSGYEVFSLAFLDIITCGFGAILLLLLVTKPLPLIERPGEEAFNLSEMIQETIESLADLQESWENLTSVEQSIPESNSQASISVEDLEYSIVSAEQTLEELNQSNRGLEKIKEELQRATIQASNSPKIRSPEVGGIPVEREYVIFIVDNSGSMMEIWYHVVDVMSRILAIHPEVKGFQVLNDNGNYLMKGTKRAWLTDSPTSRQYVREALDYWVSISTSSPAEGLEVALRSYKEYLDKTSIYILGDDFTGRSYQKVLDTLDRLNRGRTNPDARARVHAVGFISYKGNSVRYGTLMRAIAENNQGTFLALPFK